MGLWAEVKRTLNSTLGTTDFKPLDKIIEGQRTLAASDSVIQVFELDRNVANTSEYEFGRFKVKVNGSVRIIVNYSGGASNSTLRLGIKKNDIEVFYKTVEAHGGDRLLTANIKVDKESEYTITLKSSSTTYSIHGVSVGANIVDTSLVEVI